MEHSSILCVPSVLHQAYKCFNVVRVGSHFASLRLFQGAEFIVSLSGCQVPILSFCLFPQINTPYCLEISHTLYAKHYKYCSIVKHFSIFSKF